MRQRWAAILITLSTLLLAVPGARAEEDPLISAARDGERYVFAEFTSTTCPACDEMRPIVAELRSKYPNLIYQQIDADLEPDLSRKYNVKCVPVYVVVDPEGQIQFNDVGMRTADELVQILEKSGIEKH